MRARGETWIKFGAASSPSLGGAKSIDGTSVENNTHIPAASPIPPLYLLYVLQVNRSVPILSHGIRFLTYPEGSAEDGGADKEMGAKFIGAVVQSWFEKVDELKEAQPKKKRSGVCAVQ